MDSDLTTHCNGICTLFDGDIIDLTDDCAELSTSFDGVHCNTLNIGAELECETSTSVTPQNVSKSNKPVARPVVIHTSLSPFELSEVDGASSRYIRNRPRIHCPISLDQFIDEPSELRLLNALSKNCTDQNSPNTLLQVHQNAIITQETAQRTVLLPARSYTKVTTAKSGSNFEERSTVEAGGKHVKGVEPAPTPSDERMANTYGNAGRKSSVISMLRRNCTLEMSDPHLVSGNDLTTIKSQLPQKILNSLLFKKLTQLSAGCLSKDIRCPDISKSSTQIPSQSSMQPDNSKKSTPPHLEVTKEQVVQNGDADLKLLVSRINNLEKKIASMPGIRPTTTEGLGASILGTMPEYETIDLLMESVQPIERSEDMNFEKTCILPERHQSLSQQNVDQLAMDCVIPVDIQKILNNRMDKKEGNKTMNKSTVFRFLEDRCCPLQIRKPNFNIDFKGYPPGHMKPYCHQFLRDFLKSELVVDIGSHKKPKPKREMHLLKARSRPVSRMSKKCVRNDKCNRTLSENKVVEKQIDKKPHINNKRKISPRSVPKCDSKMKGNPPKERLNQICQKRIGTDLTISKVSQTCKNHIDSLVIKKERRKVGRPKKIKVDPIIYQVPESDEDQDLFVVKRIEILTK